MASERLRVRVSAIQDETALIKSYTLVAADGGSLPAFTAGSHVDVVTPSGRVRQYSLAGDPNERRQYILGILRDEDGRGGSVDLHDRVAPGHLIEISVPRNLFGLEAAPHHAILIGGGIGLTPLLAMAGELYGRGDSFELHVCTRSLEATPFRARLTEIARSGEVIFHHDQGDPRLGIKLEGLLGALREDAVIYCCGPEGLMEAVRRAAGHWPAGTVRFESFGSAEATGGSVFEVQAGDGGPVMTVPADCSMLAVLRENGYDIDSSCENGSCGTCATRLLSGQPDHRDIVLSEEERQEYVMVCVSRCRGGRLVLDL